MKLKRFTAQDTRTAMKQVKLEFGADAVILSCNQVDEGVEIIAAIDFDASIVSQEAAIASARPSTPLSQKNVNAVAPLDDMRHEIQTLRDMLEMQMRSQVHDNAPLHRLLMQKLMDLGTSYETACAVIRRINPKSNENHAWQQVLHLLSERIPIADKRRIEEGGIYAFVGPTGVGKTTTLAKIAARFVLRFGAQDLGLITMDTFRIAAEEQLVVYGKILGVSVCVAQDEAALARTLRQLSDKKLILIDTAGMSPSDTRIKEQLDILQSKFNHISTVLVMPATSQYQVLNDVIARFQSSHLDQCIVTKLDESQALGGVISALCENQLGVSYLTNGQRVPEDIKMATRHQLIEQLAEQEHHLQKRTQPTEHPLGEAYV